MPGSDFDWRERLPTTKVVAAVAGCMLSLAFAVQFSHPLTPPEPQPQEQEDDLPAALSLEKNAEFLAANATKPDVTVTDSGLQFRVLAPGTGKRPGPKSTVTVHYAGSLIDGTEFDSSRTHGPVSFPLNRVIPGWTEGLQLMREGERAELVIPQELGYGPEGSQGAIPPYQTLVFDVELIRVQ